MHLQPDYCPNYSSYMYKVLFLLQRQKQHFHYCIPNTIQKKKVLNLL